MTVRGRLLAAVVGLSLMGVYAVACAPEAVAAAQPEINLSTTTLVPGQKFAVHGTGWPDGTALTVRICGADDALGTSDCADTGAVTVIATSAGEVAAEVVASVPPAPCPCVVLVNGVSTQYTDKIPVRVAGASTSPVPPQISYTLPDLQVRDLHVTASRTLKTSLGASVHQTVTLRVANVGHLTETPLLIGRWGTGRRLTNVIVMPTLSSLGPGRSVDVRARFTLPALSVGTYKVSVTAEVEGFDYQTTATTTTSQWPIALFVLAAVVLALLVAALVLVGRRRRRARRGPPAPQVPAEPRPLASSAVSEERSAALSRR